MRKRNVKMIFKYQKINDRLVFKIIGAKAFLIHKNDLLLK